MALIDKASLLMVPSTYEAGTLYNVLPSGNRAPDSTNQNSGYDQTRADFDFDRGSNASATRIGSDGLIEKYRENEALQSNLFNVSPWSLGNSVLTANATTSPTGESNAAKIESNGINKETRTRQTISGATTGKVYTFSCYMKAGNVSYGIVRHYGISSNGRAWFNLSTGTIGTKDSTLIDAQIESVGDGWYRCSITGKITTSGALDLAPAPNDNDYLSDAAGEYVFLYGAQAESSLVASSYLESTSVTGKAGVLVDLPRINYDANGENGALLLEPSRANKTEHAEYFEGWSRVNTGVAILDANAYTSPEGLQNAYKVTFTEGGGQSQIYKVLSGFTIGTKYTQSLYVKYISGSGENFQIVKSFGTAGVRCTFTNGGADLSVIAVGGTQANDFGKEPLGNGWFRIWFTYASNTTNWEINISRNSGTGSDVYAIYGHQIEEGNYVSSYIPTMGTSETRAADSCSVTGVSDVIGQTEGTLYVDVKFSKHISEISDGTSTNRIVLYTDGSGYVRNLIRASSVTTSNIQTNTTIQAGDKIALAYSNNDSVIYKNGVQIGSDTSVTIPATSKVNIGSDYAGNASETNTLNQAIVFKTRLTNAELATLTTL